MRNPFIWFSGADTSVIDLCQKRKLYEKIKFSGIGALVLAPAVVGFFSMSYAVSTVVDEPWKYYGGGLVWALLILAIDRLLVSTTTKSDVKPTGISAVIARYVLALFLGFAIAHPLVLRWFDESIQQRLYKKKDQEISNRRQSGENEKKNLGQGPLSKQIAEKNEELKCRRALETDEQSGINSSRPCGSTSERSGPECGIRCINIQKQIRALEKEIGILETRSNDTGETAERATAITSIDNATNRDIERIENRFAKDYLARVDALSEIQNGTQATPSNALAVDANTVQVLDANAGSATSANASSNGNVNQSDPPKPHVWWVAWFMIVFFMVVDIVPITLKLAIPMGEYEMISDTQLVEVQLKNLAEQAAFKAHAETVYQSMAQAKLNNVAYMDNISNVHEMTREFIRKLENSQVEFSRKLDEIRARVAAIKDEERRQVYIKYMDEIKNTFDASVEKAVSMFQKFIQGLK